MLRTSWCPAPTTQGCTQHERPSKAIHIHTSKDQLRCKRSSTSFLSLEAHSVVLQAHPAWYILSISTLDQACRWNVFLAFDLAWCFSGISLPCKSAKRRFTSLPTSKKVTKIIPYIPPVQTGTEKAENQL